MERGDKFVVDCNDVLFDGSACFPLSPSDKLRFGPDGQPEPTNDILQSIFDLIGTPNKVDLSFISDAQAFDYIRKFQLRSEADYAQKFPSSCDQSRDLLKKMLKFNPFFRLDAE